MKKYILITLSILILGACSSDKKQLPTTVVALKNKKSELLKSMDNLKKELIEVEKKLAKFTTEEKLQIVTVLKAKKENFKHYLELQGVVKADKNIEIRPEMGGTVTRIYVKEGQYVPKGKVLMQLDDSQLQNGINEIKTQLTLASTTFERQSRLWKQKIGSEMQYLQAKTQKEALENKLKTLNSQAGKFKITAPFSGTIDKIVPKVGELTSPQLPVIRLLNLKEVYVEAEVTESYLSIIKKGTKSVLYFPSINKKVTSKISQVGNYINPANRSFVVKMNVNNNDRSIKPNLLADLEIVDFESEGIVIPINLVQKDRSGKEYVYTVVTKDNESKVVKTMISVSKSYENKAFVSKGLLDGDILINKGARIVKEGELVDIK